MSNQPFPALDIIPYWARLNDELVALVDLVPDDKLDWSPKRELWNFRGILIHICGARHNWMARDVKDGEPTPDYLRVGQTKDGMKEQLRLSWERLQRFLADQRKLDAVYEGIGDGEAHSFTGHWLAFHGIEHDIHHRADVLHYLALLGVEHPEVGTP
jgi:uncharacterized damage-inducible protein DinB